MKKKLNLFCALIFVAIVCDLLAMSNAAVTGFSAGMKQGMEKRAIHETSLSNYCNISLLPVEINEANAVTMTGNSSGESREAWPTQLIVPMKEHVSPFVAMFKLLYTLALAVVGVAALVAFIIFVRNINKSIIFSRRNISLLRVMGWCLVAAGAIASADGCYDTYIAQQVFSLEGYVVDYSSAVNITSIIFGLFSLVMAEAFAIGLKMKEEQELTI